MAVVAIFKQSDQFLAKLNAQIPEVICDWKYGVNTVVKHCMFLKKTSVVYNKAEKLYKYIHVSILSWT